MLCSTRENNFSSTYLKLILNCMCFFYCMVQMIYNRSQSLYTKHLLSRLLKICLFFMFLLSVKIYCIYWWEIWSQGHIQKPCGLSDEALCNFLPLLIAAKSPILNVAEFLDLFLKILPCTKTSQVSCKNQSFMKCDPLYQNSLCYSVTLQKQLPEVFFKNRCS